MDRLTVLECPVCGGALEKLSETAYKCRFCGNLLEQKPSLPDDVSHNLMSAAALRRTYEFAKAGDAYQAVLEKHRDVCEANWGAFLCRYGVNYVPDRDGRFHPTFWRVDNKRVGDNPDYKTAVALCGEDSRANYIERGDEIEAVRSAIAARMKSGCDGEIYLCVRSRSDDGGAESASAERKLCDSVFDYLTDCGYKVFYEPRSLNKLIGEAAEPEIFAALNSCRMMLVPECGEGESVWIKDKYMRFKALAQAGSGKSIAVLTSTGLVASTFLNGCPAILTDGEGWRTKLRAETARALGPRESTREKAEREKAEAEAARAEAERKKAEKQKTDAEVASTVSASSASSGFGASAFTPPHAGSRKTADGGAFRGAKAGGGPSAGKVFDGAIATDPRALREIAQMIRSYCAAQGRICDGYVSGIRSLTHDWNDEGYRQLLQAVGNVRAKLGNQLPRMEQFARWLEQKADLLDHMPR